MQVSQRDRAAQRAREAARRVAGPGPGDRDRPREGGLGPLPVGGRARARARRRERPGAGPVRGAHAPSRGGRRSSSERRRSKTRSPSAPSSSCARRRRATGDRPSAPNGPPSHRRQYVRAPYVTPVVLVAPDGDELEARSEEISEEGMLVVAPVALELGAPLQLRFASPMTGEMIVLQASVRWTREGRGRSAVGSSSTTSRSCCAGSSRSTSPRSPPRSGRRSELAARRARPSCGSSSPTVSPTRWPSRGRSGPFRSSSSTSPPTLASRSTTRRSPTGCCLQVAWPSIGSFVLVHAAGAAWAFARDAARVRRLFVATTAVLLGRADRRWRRVLDLARHAAVSPAVTSRRRSSGRPSAARGSARRARSSPDGIGRARPSTSRP